MIPLHKQINSAFANHPNYTLNSKKFSWKPQKRLDFTINLLQKLDFFPQEIVQAFTKKTNERIGNHTQVSKTEAFQTDQIRE